MTASCCQFPPHDATLSGVGGAWRCLAVPGSTWLVMSSVCLARCDLCLKLLSALLSCLPQQVVSGDEGGTIVLWNLADGRRAGGFSLHAAPASAAGAAANGGSSSPSAASKAGGHGSERLTAMAFDAAQRRLLTASDAGGLRAYNFNSGWAGAGCAGLGAEGIGVALLGLPLESSQPVPCAVPLANHSGGALHPLSAPLWIGPSQCKPALFSALHTCVLPYPSRLRRAVLREFREGARRRGSRQHEGGKEITAVAFVAAALPPAVAQQHADCDGGEASSVPAGEQPAAEQQERGGQPADAQQPMQVGASGSSEGYSELSEHALLSMQAQRASQAQAAAAEASAADNSDSRADDAPNLVLATGWCRALCVWEEGEERVCESSRRLPGHAADVMSLAPLGPHVAATGERGCRVGRGVGIDLFSGHGVGGGAAWHLQHTCTRSALLSLPPLPRRRL